MTGCPDSQSFDPDSFRPIDLAAGQGGLRPPKRRAFVIFVGFVVDLPFLMTLHSLHVLHVSALVIAC
jgi:hypothetical protein